jgi:hypothetical protein
MPALSNNLFRENSRPYGTEKVRAAAIKFDMLCAVKRIRLWKLKGLRMHIALQLLAGVLAAVLFIFLVRGLFAGSRALNVYALSLVITALIYVVFAVRGGATGSQLWLELAGAALFTSFAVQGRKVPMFLVAGWAGHSLWDLILHKLMDGMTVPSWYPLACLSFDLVVAAYIARTFKRSPST